MGDGALALLFLKTPIDMSHFMKKIQRPFYLLPLLTAAFMFSACGKKSDAPGESSSAALTSEYPAAADQAIQMVVRELAKNNGVVLWQAMPESYQNDVNGVVQLAGSRIDAEIYDTFFKTIQRVVTVLDQKKEFVFNSSLGGQAPDPEQAERLRTAWPSVMRLVNSLANSSLASAAGLQSFDGKTFFTETVSSILAEVDALSKLQPDSEEPLLSDFENAVIKYVSGTDTEATLEMSSPGGEVETEVFTKVENRWVPKETANQWTKQISEVRTKLQAIDPAEFAKQKPQFLSVMAMFDGVISQIEAAETQKDFDQAMKGAMMPLMGIMMMGQGMGGETPAPVMPSAPSVP